MSDKELLELAAKALQQIGCQIEQEPWSPGAQVERALYVDGQKWDPLTDDGDALRLAVKLKINLEFDFDRIDAIAEQGGICITEYIYEKPTLTDPYSATRRAIVRAAAEIGKLP